MTKFLLIYSIILPVYVLFVTYQAYLKPFKNKFINILDLSVVINYVTVLCTKWYFIGRAKYYCTLGILDATLIHVLMFTFFVILFYYIVLVTGQQARFIGYINVVQYSIKNDPMF